MNRFPKSGLYLTRNNNTFVDIDCLIWQIQLISFFSVRLNPATRSTYNVNLNHIRPQNGSFEAAWYNTFQKQHSKHSTRMGRGGEPIDDKTTRKTTKSNDNGGGKVCAAGGLVIFCNGARVGRERQQERGSPWRPRHRAGATTISTITVLCHI